MSRLNVEMRYLAPLILLFACLAANGQPVTEPQYDDTFFAVDATGKLLPLERQKATFHASVGFMALSGMKLSSQITPAASPIRFKGDEQPQFVVRSVIVSSSSHADPNIVYVLHAFKKKGNKREFVTSSAHVTGFGSASSSAEEGTEPIKFERYGEGSLKIVSERPLPPSEY